MKLHGTMDVNEEGILNIGGISTLELADKFGTPLLVLDEDELRKNISQYVDSFTENYSNFKVLYAAKAFLNRTLCKILIEEGVGLDVVSGGELYIALQAGFPPEDIFFHGNNKLPSELEMGLNNDIGRFMVDNHQEAELLNKLAGEKGKQVDVILRVTPGIEAHTHEFIQTGHLDSKFGVSFTDNQALNLVKKMITFKNLNLKGLHAHIGSQIFDFVAYEKLIEVMFEFLDEIRKETGKLLKELDLGGGLGIIYTEQDDPPVIENFIEALSEKVIDEASNYDYPLPQVLIEPGRSIVGTAGTTLYRVGTIKQVPEMSKYIAVDGGMTDNIRPALYDANYDACLANRCDEKPEEKVTVAGKCCESGDILIEDIDLPAARPGDVLAVASTGAYTYAMSSNYNGIPRLSVVMVRNGEANLIIERESYDDLIKNDIIPKGY